MLCKGKVWNFGQIINLNRRIYLEPPDTTSILSEYHPFQSRYIFLQQYNNNTNTKYESGGRWSLFSMLW